MSYVVDLDAFHGPLDLLLYLIDKNELDIYDIPIADITGQYMNYLQETGDFDLERLGDFLSMASYLLNLKSKMLLPGTTGEDEDGTEEADPRAELVEKLLEYKRYKKAAEQLASKQAGEVPRVFYRDGDEIKPIVTGYAVDLRSLIQVYKRLEQAVPELEQPMLIPDGDVNVEEKMQDILNILKENKKGLIFQKLFTGIQRKKEMLALFMALLELVRKQEVVAVQEPGWAEIKIYLRVAV